MTKQTQQAEGAVPTRYRRRKHRWTVVAGALGVILFGAAGGYWWLSSTSAVSAQGVDDCTEVPVDASVSGTEIGETTSEICEALGALPTAWAAHDAEAYGAAFTENATYTTFAGTHYSGREEIASSHQALFEGPLAGTELADRFLSLRVLAEDVAVMTTRGDTYSGEAPGELGKVQTYTLVREGDEWKIAAFHNTERKPVMERIQYLWMPETIPDAER